MDKFLAFLGIVKEEWWVGVLGLLAALIVLASFFMKNEWYIRVVNVFGAILWVVYGLLSSTMPNVILNGALIVVHLVRMAKLRKQRLQQKVEQSGEQQN